MKKLLLGALLVLGLSGPEVCGQFFTRPPGVSPFRPSPFSPYGYGNYPYGGYPYGYPRGTTGFGAQGVPGTAPVTTVVIDPTGRLAQNAAGTDSTSNDTGHPTRFFSYSQYFFNQGGSTIGGGGYQPGIIGAPGLGTGGIGIGSGTGIGGSRAGTAPPRGRSNTGNPSR